MAELYNNKLSNSTSKEMFKILNDLLNKCSNNLPDWTSSLDLAGSFCVITGKIDRMRDEVENTYVSPHDVSFLTIKKTPLFYV